MKCETILEQRDSEHVERAIQSLPINKACTLICLTNMDDNSKVEIIYVGHSLFSSQDGNNMTQDPNASPKCLWRLPTNTLK